MGAGDQRKEAGLPRCGANIRGRGVNAQGLGSRGHTLIVRP